MKQLLQLFAIALFLSSCTTEKAWEPDILKKYKQIGIASKLPNFSYAGYQYGEISIPDMDGKIFDITAFGAIPNDGLDDTKAINHTIDSLGRTGGGIVFFPSGMFHVNMDSSKVDNIQINYGNIVLRGSGSGENGTVIFSGNPMTQSEDNSPWLSPFVFHSGLNLHNTSSFFSVDSLNVFSTISQYIKAGDSIVNVNKTKGLKPGDVIIIALRNTTDAGDLMNDLMRPLKFEPFQTGYLNAGIQSAASFQWPVEIDSVLDATHIQLKQPARRDLLLKYKPSIFKMPMLKNIGIEHFKFESAWDGNYKHHGNRDMDYGWGAINLHRVSHGWIRDIHIDNYTQTTHLVNSRNITIEDIYITGKKGHYSPKMYHSSDNLVQNIQVDQEVTHGPGLEGCSFGNVYRNVHFKHASTIDLHGMADIGFCPPMYNLFENITNIGQIAGGGAPSNIPHSGEYNTFWDIEIEGWKDGKYKEIFYSWIWRDSVKFKNKMHIDCHKQYLRSHLIGVHSKDSLQKLSIEHNYYDRSDEWIYVEGLNYIKDLTSLYETQLQLRLNK
jgi:hypothetical protein